LKLNPHLHVVFLDGAYVARPDGQPVFRALPRLSTTGVADVLQVARARILRHLERRGVISVDDEALRKRDVTWKGPVKVTSPLRTILDCKTDAVAPDLVRQAIAQGVKRGLFSRDDVIRTIGTRAKKHRANGTS
jgi:hypothetical protein